MLREKIRRKGGRGSKDQRRKKEGGRMPEDDAKKRV